MTGVGCVDCGETGYRGRTAVFEVLPITAAVRRVLLSTPTEQGLRAAARAAGMLPLRAAGLAKASRGETTYEEVLRVTHVDAGDGRACRLCERSVAEDMVVCPWCATADRPRALLAPAAGRWSRSGGSAPGAAPAAATPSR